MKPCVKCFADMGCRTLLNRWVVSRCGTTTTRTASCPTKASGGAVHETTDRNEALAGAHVIYAKEWGSPQHYGDNEADARLREYLSDWCVKDSWFRTTAENCRFMHCLPVRRNVAVADEVLDGPRSVVVQEAFNRMVVQMAVLYRLLRG